MPAGVYEFSLEQGTSWSQKVIVKSNGNPTNLTGFSARMQIKKIANTSTEAMATPEAIITDPAAGEITLSLTGKQSSAMKVSGTSWQEKVSAVYDLKLIGPDGSVKRVLNGFVKISPEVTF